MDTHFWISQQLNRFDNTCSFAEQRIGRAKTMQDVVQATQVAIPPEIRAMRNSSPAYRKMLVAAERKLDAMVNAQLKTMADSSLDVVETLFARCLARDWQPLRGHFSRVFSRAEREARQILHKKRSS